MKKIILHAPEKDSGCNYYRNTLPVLHCYRDLAQQGIELVSYEELLDIDVADVYVFQRVVPDLFLPYLMKLKENGAYLVFQTDDDLWNVPVWNPAHGKLTYNDREATTVALDLVDEIVTSTQVLAQMINKPEKTTILPNLLDTAAYHPRPSQFEQYRTHDEMVRILWAGGNSHDGDLEQIVNPVLRLIERYGTKVQFVFFGYLPTGLADFVRIPSNEIAYLKPKHEGTILFVPPTPHRLYHDVLISVQADIAIAPLTNCLFNFSKSNIKSLEYTMAGSAFVGTNFPPYDWIKDGEHGRLVPPDNEEQWFEVLCEMIENRAGLIRMQRNAREEVFNKHTWQSEARNLWLEYFVKLGQ